uniref:Uncharacterized protein n=1 Tax=Arundo donax TaxID=35708 RepID=A0A0A9CMJ5_ARUDO
MVGLSSSRPMPPAPTSAADTREFVLHPQQWELQPRMEWQHLLAWVPRTEPVRCSDGQGVWGSFRNWLTHNDWSLL